MGTTSILAGQPQPLSNVVDVEVIVSPALPPQPTFNIGLILGVSPVIPVSDRTRLYHSANDMLADGFTTVMPEYIAASLYFSQAPAPRSLYVGRIDNTVLESPVDALQACLRTNASFWAVMMCDAVKADHQALAQFAESALPAICYFYGTSDADIPSGTAGNILDLLKQAGYRRSFGIYATTQTGNAPNNAYIAAAAMGVAMGLNTGLANSFFTQKFKVLTGCLPESLTPTQVSNIEIKNGNLYLNYGNAYQFLEQGVVAGGQFLDEILNLDMLASAIQYGVMNLLVSNPSVPLTDAGETQLIHAINQVCDQAVLRGFIAPGNWTGATLLNLSAGDPLNRGYLAMAESFTKQTPADRAARKAMPVYLAIIEAGAMHSVLIGVYVQR